MNYGRLKLNEVIVSDNTGDGIQNFDEPATATIQFSTITRNNGVGILNSGSYGPLFIISSSVSDNKYGISIDFDGTGFASTLVLINSTVANNNWTAGSFGIADLTGICNAFIANSTISGNGHPATAEGGGIYADCLGFISNTIVADNVASSDPDCGAPSPYSAFPKFSQSDNNIFGVEGGCPLGDTDIMAEPKLDDYTDNGLPGKGHFPLLADSPAIDAGTDCPPTDQLGNPRVDGDDNGSIICDIGAIEYQPAVPLTVDIDIKPGNRQNVINPRSKGGVWVAILSDTDSDNPFDPSSQVDLTTVEFGPDGAKAIRHKVIDINKDGLGDLLLRFKNPETSIVCGDTEAALTGETFDGVQINGTDLLKTVGCP